MLDTRAIRRPRRPDAEPLERLTMHGRRLRERRVGALDRRKRSEVLRVLAKNLSERYCGLL